MLRSQDCRVRAVVAAGGHKRPCCGVGARGSASGRRKRSPGSGPPTYAQIAGRRAFSPNPSMTQRCVIRRRDLWSAGTIRWLPSWAISSRPGPDPRIRPAGQARKHRRAEPLLPASAARDCFPADCVQTCGSLVRNGAEPVHMQWKCWGFLCLCRHLIGTLPGRTRVARCACRERRNYPHATPQ